MPESKSSTSKPTVGEKVDKAVSTTKAKLEDVVQSIVNYLNDAAGREVLTMNPAPPEEEESSTEDDEEEVK